MHLPQASGFNRRSLPQPQEAWDLRLTIGTCVAGLCIDLVARCSDLRSADRPAAISIPGDRLFTESLTSSRNGAVYAAIYGIDGYGSRTIYRVSPESAVAEVWIPPATANSPGYSGVFADDNTNILWACVLPGRMPGRPPTTAKRWRIDRRSRTASGIKSRTPSRFKSLNWRWMRRS